MEREQRKGDNMFVLLDEINSKPGVFSSYTASALWADKYRSKQMLEFHMNEAINLSSRRADFIERSSDWIIDHFEIGMGKSVCDFGCGPGLYTSRFAKSGAQVTGLDFSKKTIQYARRQAELAKQNVDYVEINYLDFETPGRFDLITMIMCDFCALGPEQRSRLLSKFSTLLKDGGSILLDVYWMAAFDQREESRTYEKNQLNHFWHKEDYYCFLNTFEYDADSVVLDKYSIFPEKSEPETVYNWLQYFSPQSLSTELSAAGLEVTNFYGDVSGQAFSGQHPEFAVVASRHTKGRRHW
ncbi:class I SAM-dependent methyltransferase [Ruegeria sp. HKCCA5491]|uniref:class I SAM-dependent methyltransferase n=1 Tax=Ruegeria sp. HKCCA5491 TaxID=2682986 RepID=UPI001C2C9BBC|nr:class I SAM-dependent methyltransferase [Ruegeria sp. HKCCA5491]